MDTDEEQITLPLSPVASSLASASSSSVLPERTRSRPLISGSAKESSFIRYLDEQILHVERFHAKRRAPGQTSPASEIGYTTFDEAAKDMNKIFNLVWMSSTRESGCATEILAVSLIVNSVASSILLHIAGNND
jgi:hypothetical protein